MSDPFCQFDELRNAYLRYLDSPFRLRYDDLMSARRSLLDRDRQLYREPLFEAVVPYQSSGCDLHQAADRLGVDKKVADFLVAGLFPPDPVRGPRKLYQHQLEAWEASRNGDAIIVTTGTGSGKTECYLLPMISALIEESERWDQVGTPRPDRYWWRQPHTRIMQRGQCCGRG